MCLTGWLLDALTAFATATARRWSHLRPAGTEMRGATVAMNFFDPAGALIDSRSWSSSTPTRPGSRCGAAATATRARARSRWASPNQEMAASFRDKDQLSYEEFLQVIDGKTTGAARASIGLATTFADVYRFWEFARASATRSARRWITHR